MAQNKRPICPQCTEVELTPLEEAKLKGKMCYWCYVDYINMRNSARDTQDKPHPPEDFGRTLAEFKAGRSPQTGKLGYESTTAMYSDGTLVDTSGAPPFSPDARQLLKETCGFDPGKLPVVTVIEAPGDFGTSLTLRLTAPVSPEWKAAIEQVLDQELQGILRMLMYGPKHPKMLSDLTSRLNPGPPQFGGFNPGD